MKTRLIGPEWTLSKEKRRLDREIVIGIALPTTVAVASLAILSMIKEHEQPFFTQIRLGLGDQPFNFYKLRTMPSGTPEMRAHYLPPGTTTSYQHWIRDHRLNELPQLLNVARGDMSIVGPRPPIRSHFEETMDLLSPSEQCEWLQARSTCPAGVIDPYISNNNLQNEQADDSIERAYSDIEYAHTATRAADLAILQQTIASLFACSDINNATCDLIDQTIT